MRDKHSVVRYKDYCIKLAVKAKIAELANCRLIETNLDTAIHLFVDEQSLATNGHYGLAESVAVELGRGVNDLRIGKAHHALFYRPVEVSLQLCDSAQNPLIRASDLLANAVYLRSNHGADARIANRHFMQISLP